jgi:flagellar protein FliS
MAYTNHYLESELHSADRVDLVRLMYRGAIEATSRARRNLANGQILERSRQITKAWDILGELTRSLDHMQGGDLSRALVELYVYMQKRLLEANAEQSDGPLAEVERLLSTLAEAWALVPSIDYTY